MPQHTKEQIARLKVAKYKCQESLLFFTRYFFKEIKGVKFEVNEHHKIIAEALERVLRGETKRLIINCPPRYSKTEMAVVNFIAHALALNPKANFMHLSYSDDLVLTNSENILDIINSDAYKTLFGNVNLKKDSKAKKRWRTDAGGGLYVASTAGQVIGFGAGTVGQLEDDLDIDNFITNIDTKEKFGGAIIIDDPIKPDDADYNVRRDKINERFDNTIRSRANSRKTPIIIIMQRVHPEDLCGFLLDKEPDEWEVVKIPAIQTRDGKEEALWPFKHTLEELYKLKKANSIVFDTQYMQDPQPKEGLCFAKNELQYLDDIGFAKMMELPGIEIFYCDTADEGEDYYSMPMAKIVNGKVYIHDALFTQENLSVVEPQIIVRVGEHKPVKVFIEANNAGALHIRDLRKNIPEYFRTIGRISKIKPTNTRVIGIKNKTNKLIRILSQEGFIKEHFIFRAEHKADSPYGLFMKQIWRYLRNGKETRDDAPDSISGLAYVIRAHYSNFFD
jgi:predicted phage terminase large subunit-like protein